MDNPYQKDNLQRVPMEHYLELYRGSSPDEICKRTAAKYDESKKQFSLKFINNTYYISYPGFEISCEPNALAWNAGVDDDKAKIMLARYFSLESFVPDHRKFLSYADMPWGDVYVRQFTGRCIMRLSHTFGNDLENFARAMELLGASRIRMGDIAYELQFIENLYMQFILWRGDDEFPPNSQILFSDNFAIAFQAEDRAVAGDIVIRAMKEVLKSKS